MSVMGDYTTDPSLTAKPVRLPSKGVSVRLVFSLFLCLLTASSFGFSATAQASGGLSFQSGGLFSSSNRFLPVHEAFQFSSSPDSGVLKLHWRRSEETRLNSSHVKISYAVFCLNKKKDDIR